MQIQTLLPLPLSSPTYLLHAALLKAKEKCYFFRLIAAYTMYVGSGGEEGEGGKPLVRQSRKAKKIGFFFLFVFFVLLFLHSASRNEAI